MRSGNRVRAPRNLPRKRILRVSVPPGPLNSSRPNMIASASHLPPAFLRTLLVRGTVLWVFATLSAFAILAYAETLNSQTAATVPVWAIVVTPLLCFADLRFRKELTLLHNLGVSTAYALVVGTIPSVVIAGILVFRA